jgi:photosystem II stability/assembly factor-like uncharacterized protein
MPRRDGEGSTYWLVASTDGGASWKEVGPIPTSSVVAVAAVSKHEVWVLGAETLLASRDGGQFWREVEIPGIRNVVDDRLLTHDGHPMLAGAHGTEGTTGRR